MRDRIYRAALSLSLAWLLGAATALHAIPAAYAERGCRGVGGEWLLILAAAGVGAWLPYIRIPAKRKARQRLHR